ncbi:hypothetical protein Bealeia1_00824 [Candidatus Bealeia paramacronuclearis]|uniref:Uncharacterized protein n=1 Tax=Candidatus Bealeia paramacronuclearis TaxID=1921001 RepID=A0ABZ2C6Z6_9PROT|nr:hypothetical protein [Candidatus Bealeia paramacronuclearis]
MTMIRMMWGLLALLIITALMVLSMWGIPAPQTKVEKIIPHDKALH